jgi:anthranilate phosphoribosyltransferase
VGAGARVVKHGNRGFTSTSGAADVLEVLGAKIDLTPEQARTVIEMTGFGFLFAPAMHPAMRFVGPTRREIGIRTIFNSLGPLANPADARFQLIGVSTMEMADKISQVLRRLGTGRALVVHSDDGLDEVSLGAPTTVHEVTGADVRTYTLTPVDLGLPSIPVDEVKTGTKEENAARMRGLLGGAESADREYVLANAGVALYTVGKAPDVKTGVKQARQSIDTGAAKRVLEAYVAATNSFGG